MQFLRQYNLGFIVGDFRAPPVPASSPCGPQADLGTFLNQPALELSQRREDVEDEFSGGTGRVDRTFVE
jgi:hypothetical protein